MKKWQEYAELRAEGLTYREIADRCGCSLQNVNAMLAKRQESRFRPLGKDRVVYDGLRNWMNENHMTVSEMVRQFYGHSSTNRWKMDAMLRGESLRKKDIDFFRNLTGMTYEQLFCSQEGEDG